VNTDCLFCKLYREGEHVASTDGFVAIRDINPQAETHLLVLPEKHIVSFHEIAEFSADEDKRMLDFIAEVAAENGLTDYRVVVNAGRGRPDDLPPALARAERRTDRENGVSLITTIEDEIKEAMLARDAERRDALRLIVNSLKVSEKELQRPLSDDEELQVLQRERKKRVEAAEAFRSGGREEQAATEERELAILEEFMPEPLSEEEIEEIIDDAIAEVGATSMADLGRVMADVMPQIAGRADGSSVSQIVREKLA
jgi:hypothetical protein